MPFHTRMKELRTQNSVTQRELAEALGIRATAICNYEADRNEPSLEKLVEMAKFFHVSCDYILGLTDSSLPPNTREVSKELEILYSYFRKLTPENQENFKNYAQYLIYIQEKEHQQK